ncbi:MAG: hypothetical protein JO290_13730 [Sphingomonadaceae bacterium]|nr:hypothetical protein [Sphingomonadaceae bacterium]
MLKAKAIALCVCPLVAAPPAVIAVHTPSRHAVAHLLHRAADRLDHAAPRPAVVAPASRALPCAPSLASAGGSLPVVGGDLIGGLGEPLPTLASADAPGRGDTLATAPYVREPYAGVPYSGYGIGGGGMVGPGGGPTGIPGTPAEGPRGRTLGGSGNPGTGIVPVGTGMSSAPEPAAWAFLATGFGLVGLAARARLRATGAAGED